MSTPSTSDKPRIALSACLSGHEVRYNGGHKASSLCDALLSEHFDCVPVCPEVAIGLGIPRDAIRLVGDPESPEVVGTRDPGNDLSGPLRTYGHRMADELGDICGYVFMQKSPSCGLERVKVYQADGRPAVKGGRGAYAQAFCERRPDLPVEEEGRLHDPVLRENFISRVYAYADWQRLRAEGLSRGALVRFHSRYKYLLMANNPQAYRELGRMLGSMRREDDPQAIGARYFSQLMQALRRCASRGTHCNVLQHLCGYLRPVLDRDDKAELQQLIGQYQQGNVPLVVPLTLLKHHLRNHPDPYLLQQAYLQPHPENLGLRNAL
ncbi:MULTISPECIES: YbgA family protein [unclassified Pseudomonas]|uniref:YbgA family protein n=1 Tax=unclassified Pseudomonas TaxID=196821 RepID=UPI0035BF36B9